MMKSRFAILFIGCLAMLKLQAQVCIENLVPNPSFEDTVNMVEDVGIYIHNLDKWTSPNSSSPDYLHYCNNQGACFPFAYVYGGAVPKNFVGYQNAYQGMSYIGIIFYYDDKTEWYPYYREYAQAKLMQPLKPCTEYELSFYVSLADTSNYATPDIQAYIGRDSLTGIVFDIIDNVTPVYTGPGYAVTDTMNWTQLKTTFYAEGDEQWLTIGNFTSRYDTNLVQVRTDGRGHSYYYIDMVELCEIPKPPQSIPNIITPNGDNVNDGFYITGMYPGSRLTIYNRWGAEVYKAVDYQNNWEGKTKTMGMEAVLADGVYFYVLESECGGRQTGTVTIAGGRW